MLHYLKNTIRTSLLISFIILSFSLKAQIPTVRAVFDYDIGDEFHSQGHNNNGPPEASRVKILGKWFSQNSDTVFYKTQHNDYISSFNPSPSPHLEYVFYNYVDTAVFTDLDSSILYYLLHRSDLNNYSLVSYQFDTTTHYCQNQLHKFKFSTGGNEPDITEFYFAKGLGSLYYFHTSTSAVPAIYFESSNKYYKKANKACGTKDTVGLSIKPINPNNTLSIFPNPATDKVYIHMPDEHAYHLEIYDINSKLIFQKDIDKKVFDLDVSHYSSGIYILKIHNNDNSYSTKLIIE